jgi:hypothetical protein
MPSKLQIGHPEARCQITDRGEQNEPPHARPQNSGALAVVSIVRTLARGWRTHDAESIRVSDGGQPPLAFDLCPTQTAATRSLHPVVRTRALLPARSKR